jgi:hypothetical protein
MSGYHCLHCGAIRHIEETGFCCDDARKAHCDIFSQIIMRDPAQDKGGDAATMADINAARDQALKELGS